MKQLGMGMSMIGAGLAAALAFAGPAEPQEAGSEPKQLRRDREAAARRRAENPPADQETRQQRRAREREEAKDPRRWDQNRRKL